MKQPDSLTTRALVKRCESYAAQIRGLMSVLRTGPVNPFDCLEALQVEVVPSKLVAVGAEENAFEATFQMSAKQWSGVSAPLPDGRLLVMLNPRA